MLPTFRVLLATTGLAVLAIAGASYGLIPAPEVRTRIGEVPSISRTFIQEAMAPRRLAVQARGDPAEERAPAADVTALPTAPDIQMPHVGGAGTDRERGAATPPPSGDATRSSDPLGELIKATTRQTLERPLPLTGPISPRPRSDTGLDPPAADQEASPRKAAALTEPAAPSPAPDAVPLPPTPGQAAAEGRVAGADGIAAQMPTTETKPSKSDGAARTDGLAAAPASTPPTLALDDENNDRSDAGANPQVKPATTAVASGNEKVQRADAAVRQSVRRSVRRPAVERRKDQAAAKRRTSRHHRRSRVVSLQRSRRTMRWAGRKSRAAAYRAARRRAADPAPLRSANVVLPRPKPGPESKPYQHWAASPEVQYRPHADPFQVMPNGYRLYYSRPAGAIVAR